MNARIPVLSVRAGAVALALSLVAGAAGATLNSATTVGVPIPSPNPATLAYQGAANSGITASGFTGSWTTPAATAWVGSFTAKGPVPAGFTTTGTTRYDFTTLPTSVLPVGTYFTIGDVDHGSGGTEILTFRAYDSTSTLITSAWLDEPVWVNGTGVSAANMPVYDWSSSTGEYTFDGSGVPGNPSIGIFMPSNTAISYLEVYRSSTFCNMGLAAPLIPTPGALALAGLGGLAAVRRRR